MIAIHPIDPYREPKGAALAALGALLLMALLKPHLWLSAFITGGLLFFTSFWRGWRMAHYYAEIDVEQQTVRIDKTSILGRKQTECFNLRMFGSIISYNEDARSSRLELITHLGGEALLLGEFPAGKEPKKFLSWSNPAQESEHVAALRQQIARTCNLSDRGFVGKRWQGAQLNKSPSA